MEIKKQEWDMTYEVALEFRKVLFRTHAHTQSLFWTWYSMDLTTFYDNRTEWLNMFFLQIIFLIAFIPKIIFYWNHPYSKIRIKENHLLYKR